MAHLPVHHPLKLLVLCLALLSSGPALAQQPAPMTVAQAIETEIQTAFNKPENANAKNAFMARLSGGYGTATIFVAAHQLIHGVLPPFQNQAYENQITSYVHTLYLAILQQASANSALLQSNPALYRLTLFNYAVNQLANWIATHPAPGAQWVFVEDVGSLVRLAVLVNSATIHPSNWVLSLQTMLDGNGRWADRLITWDVDAFALSMPNESLFLDTLYGL